MQIVRGPNVRVGKKHQLVCDFVSWETMDHFVTKADDLPEKDMQILKTRSGLLELRYRFSPLLQL